MLSRRPVQSLLPIKSKMFSLSGAVRLIGSRVRCFSTGSTLHKKYQCKLLVVGGGSGGCAVAAKFSRRLARDAVIVLDPADNHYYQPLFTLVGAGVKKLSDSRRSEKDVLPTNATWLKDSADTFDPHRMIVTTKQGDEISYEYLVIAVGLQLDYDKIPGMKEALERPDSGVSTIYSPLYCEKTWSDMRATAAGEVLFTYPAGPVKCPGAPQKICYLADSYFRKTGNRSRVNITYNSNLSVLFGVKKYADALWKVAERKGIHVNLQSVLTEIRPDSREAIFQSSGEDGQCMTVRYSMLHTVPPMSPPACLASNTALADSAGFLNVDKYTLQHRAFPNVYGLGDCTNTPNSKTAAAIATQCFVLEHNLLASMKQDTPSKRYNGYGACPLLTSYSTCIMAEFDYDLKPIETLPINQAKERVISYYMKKDLFPFLYWNLLLKGRWHGPSTIRRIINPLANP